MHYALVKTDFWECITSMPAQLDRSAPFVGPDRHVGLPNCRPIVLAKLGLGWFWQRISELRTLFEPFFTNFGKNK